MHRASPRSLASTASSEGGSPPSRSCINASTMAGSISSTDSANNGSSGASSSSSDARKAARAAGSQPGRLSAKASASNSAILLSAGVAAGWRVLHAVVASLRRRCSIMIAAAASCCVLLGAASVWSLCGVWQRFLLQRSYVFGVSRDKCKAYAIIDAILAQLCVLFGLQSPSELSRRGGLLAYPRGALGVVLGRMPLA